MKYHKNHGNLILNLIARMKYTKLLGKMQTDYVPVNFKDYKDVYVFCDSDPIGYYLSYKEYHIMLWKTDWTVSALMIRQI